MLIFCKIYFYFFQTSATFSSFSQACKNQTPFFFSFITKIFPPEKNQNLCFVSLSHLISQRKGKGINVNKERGEKNLFKFQNKIFSFLYVYATFLWDNLPRYPSPYMNLYINLATYLTRNMRRLFYKETTEHYNACIHFTLTFVVIRQITYKKIYFLFFFTLWLSARLDFREKFRT